MIKLVALDFDDTLAMTEEATFQMENETARRMGYPPMTREAHKKNWGKPLEEAIVERFPGINPEEFMRKLYEAHQRTHHSLDFLCFSLICHIMSWDII